MGWSAKGRGAQAQGEPATGAAPARGKFRKGTLHVTARLRPEVWNLRTHRCFRALRRSFERGCRRFGFRLVHFSVQGNHVHMVVEAPDPQSLARAMKGLEVRMARALNKVMNRRGPVFADRCHSHLLRSPRETAHAVRYVLENWSVHARREGWSISAGVDPYCSTAFHGCEPPLVAEPLWWMLRVGVARLPAIRRAA